MAAAACPRAWLRFDRHLLAPAHEWANAGVFDALHLAVLDRLGEQGQLDWSRASVDNMSVRARRPGTIWAQIRSIVASLGSKLHVVCDGNGLPLTAAVTAANVADVTRGRREIGMAPGEV